MGCIAVNGLKINNRIISFVHLVCEGCVQEKFVSNRIARIEQHAEACDAKHETPNTKHETPKTKHKAGAS